ncbi:MAG TPA: glycosyltransferase family 39 protein [Candidatus Binatia bacterium]|jgi:hypothetical protein
MNVLGITWGVPARWHPDEITGRSIEMVRNSDFSPHYFAYGGLHYFMVGGLAVLPINALRALGHAAGSTDKASGHSGTQTTQIWIMVAARTISALMGAAVVAITIEMGTRLFSPAAGLAAGSLLLPARGFVLIAHYATVDMGANFWYWLACAGTLGIWKTGSRRAYLLSGIAAGLAAGTKIDRSVVVLPLITAHLLRGRASSHRNLFTALGMAVLFYVISNPALVLTPFDFLDGSTRELMFNGVTPQINEPFRRFVLWLRWAYGDPLLILTIAGIALGAFILLFEQRRSELVWVAATVIPLSVLYSRISMDRYVNVLFPGFALLAGYAVARLLIEGPSWRRLLTSLPIAAALGWSMIACLGVDLAHLRDPRYAAAEWLEQNAPIGSRVVLDEYGPLLSDSRYHVSRLQADAGPQEEIRRARERLRQCEFCQGIRTAIFEAERKITGALGRSSPPRTPYIGWFDGPADRAESRRDELFTLPAADYVLLLPNRNPVTRKHLAAPGSGYERVAYFPRPCPFGITVPFPFVALAVEIYARQVP